MIIIYNNIVARHRRIVKHYFEDFLSGSPRKDPTGRSDPHSRNKPANFLVIMMKNPKFIIESHLLFVKYPV